MLSELDQVKAAVEFMRSQGVSAFKWGGLEVNFEPGVGANVGQDASPVETPVTEEQRNREEEELLFHSAI